jgi:hypothetical protein
MAAMETQALDDLTDDSEVMAHRTRAASRLDQIAQQVKLTLSEQGIDISLFFIVPSSGDAILPFGTVADPDDVLWERVGEIVADIVGRAVGLDRTRRRPVVCASTDAVGDHQTSQSADPAGWPTVPIPIPTPAAQHAGAE